MKIALVQQNYTVGDIKGNAQLIESSTLQAKEKGAELVVFPELAICGYPPQDLLTYNGFVNDCQQHIRDIAKKCIDVAVIIGGPSFNHNGNGKKLFNSAFFLCDGVIAQVIHKTLLPTYDIFDEYRYFEPAKKFEIIAYLGQKIALTICEDLWAEADVKLYTGSPMEQLIQQKPDLIINIAASPFSYLQAEDRKNVLAKNAQKYQLPILYINHVGTQTDLCFDGGSLFMDSSGNIIQELPYFKESLSIIETGNSIVNTPSTSFSNATSQIALIYDALVMGISDYFKKMGFKKAILGLSGGIDSAIVAVLAQKALGADNVLGILMPSQYSSSHSISDALKLAENIGISHQTIAIEEGYAAYMNMLEPLFKDSPFNLAEENLQARIRGVLLMALSNKFGHILLNTTNKSEMAVGYGTLYGDMCGGLAVLGDVYKTQVYDLAQYINADAELIPQNSITKAPSAELRPDQKDSDSLPEYTILDKILSLYIEEVSTASEIIAHGYEKSMVESILKLVNRNEYKRFQAAPVLRVSPKAFGRGRVMPIVGKY